MEKIRKNLKVIEEAKFLNRLEKAELEKLNF